MQFVITGRGARIKHMNLEGAVLCPQSKATTEATGRFDKLPICKVCAERFMEIAEERAAAREAEAEATAKAEAEQKAAEEQVPAEGTQVTIVYTGDRDPAIHRPGCSHIKREKTRSGGHTETITVTSRAAIVEHVYEDIMDEGYTVDDLYHSLTWVACVNEVLGYDTAEVELAEGETATEDAVQIHFSARVARYLADNLAQELPGIAGDLAAAKHKRMGRGYTAFVVTNMERATQLLELMKVMAAEMNSGKLKTTGMGFRAEAVEKGVEHITADLWSALTPA